MKIVFLAFLIYYPMIVIESSDNCQNWLNSENNEFLIEYIEWRQFTYLVIMDQNLTTDCRTQFFKNNMRELREKSIYITFMSSADSLGPLLDRKIYKILVVTFENNFSSENFMETANQITQNSGDDVAWLIMTNHSDISNLGSLEFSLDADIVITVIVKSLQKNELHDDESKVQINYCTFPNEAFSEEMTNNIKTDIALYSNASHLSVRCLFQIYKIRKNIPKSLVIISLGFWSQQYRTEFLRDYLNVEGRINFKKFPLIAGTRNSSEVLRKEGILFQDDNYASLLEFYSYFSTFLNASENVVNYLSIGDLDANGEGTDLMGGIIKKEIDIGIDKIEITPKHAEYISFTNDIFSFTRNIYLLPEGSGKMRDIFLGSFNFKLKISVIAVCLLFALVMALNNKIIAQFFSSEYRKRGFMDSLFCCLGLFANQGNMVKPKYCSEYILTVVFLLFTIIIVNSFSAFITSVLSVQLANIRNIEDLLRSDYKIGYTKNSDDEFYLRTTNFTQLNQIYLRGYLKNNVSSIKEGLIRATEGNYGFFAKGPIARKDFLNISSYKCTYNIDEIPISNTKATIAFPLSKNSPYKKVINLGLIKLYESGVYKYLYHRMNPDLIQCQYPKTYHSASLLDLSNAFVLLLFGHAAGILLVFLENLWKRRMKLLDHEKMSLRKAKTGAKIPFTN